MQITDLLNPHEGVEVRWDEEDDEPHFVCFCGEEIVQIEHRDSLRVLVGMVDEHLATHTDPED